MEVHVEFRHKSFFFLQHHNQNAGGYTCLVKNIIVTDPNSTKITVQGVHQANQTNRDVIGISMRNQTHLQKFPRGFGEVFPNLKYFEIDNSSITMLYKEDFRDLGHLQGLWLPRNPIVAIPNDLFMNVQGLRFLSFFENKLKYIGHDILQPLKNLEQANFCSNTTIDFSYGGEPEQLATLKREISEKCCSAKSMKLDLSTNKYNELEKRCQLLEIKVKKLETENGIIAAKQTQFAGLAQMVEALNNRFDDMENRMQIY